MLLVMTSSPPLTGARDRVDLVVVGAGIVGLAHAVHAVARGATVAVVERDARAVGASVRNFGHGCVTGQTGPALQYAMDARTEWLRLAKEAGFWLRDAGTVVVARADDERAVLEDFAAERRDDVVLLDAAQVHSRVPVGPDVVGGAWLPLDLRVDPLEAVAAIARWLAERGVTFHWRTSVTGVECDEVRTSRGSLRASRVVVAVGHDVDRLYPDVAAEAAVTRCTLHMLQLADSGRGIVDPAVLTGWSMLRYSGFAVSPALQHVRERLTATDPAGIAAGLNLMFTQRPQGDLVLGDTHAYGDTVVPFRDERNDDLLLAQARRLLGVDAVSVVNRWQGLYASAPEPFLVASPAPAIRVVSVTSGIGMTTALGLARRVVDDMLG